MLANNKPLPKPERKVYRSILDYLIEQQGPLTPEQQKAEEHRARAREEFEDRIRRDTERAWIRSRAAYLAAFAKASEIGGPALIRSAFDSVRTYWDKDLRARVSESGILNSHHGAETATGLMEISLTTNGYDHLAFLLNREIKRHRAAQVIPGALAILDAITDPVARLVLDQHRRVPDGHGWVCAEEECGNSDCENGYEDGGWPCATTSTVAAHFDADLSLSHDFVRPEDGSLDYTAAVTR